MNTDNPEKLGKSVIFVGGTAYSGSTLLDMMLANDPEGFSCGELNAAVQPYLKHHVNPGCGCGETDCPIWHDVKGREHVHEHLFADLEQVRFLVDSSKDIPWILANANRLNANGIDVRHVLIWKTPAEYFKSREKRGERNHWAESWINYHRAYMALLHPFVAVRYADLVRTQDTFSKLCEAVQLPYFPGKENYWDKEQHTLFGNSSAKIHLHSEDSDDFKKMSSELSNHAVSEPTVHRQEIYYDDVQDTSFAEHATEAQLQAFAEITQNLEANSPLESAGGAVPWGLAGVYLQYTRLNSWWRSKRFSLAN